MVAGSQGWSLPDYAGPYPVGTRLTEHTVARHHRIALPLCPPLRTLKVRAFYPTNDAVAETCASQSSREVRPVWATPAQIAGWAKFAGLPIASAILEAPLHYLLSDVRIQALTDAPLREPWVRRPVVLFSPGLGGTDMLYSALCGNLASFGVVVYCLEHRDHSASSTIIHEEGNEARADEHVPYISIVKQDMEENKQRAKFMLAHRRHELMLLTRLLQQEGSCTGIDARVLDWERLAWMGHSFGGATMVHALNTQPAPLHDLAGNLVQLPDLDMPQQVKPKAAVILDLWTQPLPETVQIGVPVLHLVSEEFAAWPVNHDRLLDYCSVFEAARKANLSSLDQVEATVCSTAQTGDKTQSSVMEYQIVRDSLHLSQSDAGVLFPWLVSTLTRKTRTPQQVLLDNVQQSLAFLDRFGILKHSNTEASRNSFVLIQKQLEEPRPEAPTQQEQASVAGRWWSWLRPGPRTCVQQAPLST